MGVVTGMTSTGVDGTSVMSILAGTPPGFSGHVEYQYDYGPELLPNAACVHQGMWRYSGLLPLDDGPILYPLAIGQTPLTGPPPLRAKLRMPGLWLKDETRAPTASNKDRATGLVLEHALRTGATTVSCASTGNIAASLAVGAAAVGLEAVVFVPADVSTAKLAVILFAGARVLLMRSGYQSAFELSREAAVAFGWLDRNTGVNPATTEAKKTAAFEIWEQLGGEIPDVVVVPAGDGVTLCGMAKGFHELRACGASTTLPRIVGVQAEGCQPLKRAWEQGTAPAEVDPVTIADGIAVGTPVSGGAAIRYVRESRGGFVAVSDDNMLRASELMGRHAGVIAEPAGAAALAGLLEAVESGLIGASERVVVHVTGSGLKTPQYLRSEVRPPEIDATLDDVSRALGRDGQTEGILLGRGEAGDDA